MHKILAKNQSLILGLVLAILMQSCGGVVVGNPHGGGGAGKQPRTGQIQFMIVSNESKQFSKASFNIKGLSVVKATQRETVNLEAVRRVETVKLQKNIDPSAGLLFRVPADTYQRIEIELDDNNPASVFTTEGREAALATPNNRKKLALSQGFVVDPDKTSSLNLFIDLDRSIVRSESGVENYGFSPVGGLTKSDAVRQLKIVSSSETIHKVCVFYERASASTDPIAEGIYAPTVESADSSNEPTSDDFAPVKPLPDVESSTTVFGSDNAKIPMPGSEQQLPPEPVADGTDDMPCDDAIAVFQDVTDLTTSVPYPGRYAVTASYGHGIRYNQQVELTTALEATVVFDSKEPQAGSVPGAEPAVLTDWNGDDVEDEDLTPTQTPNSAIADCSNWASLPACASSGDVGKASNLRLNP